MKRPISQIRFLFTAIFVAAFFLPVAAQNSSSLLLDAEIPLGPGAPKTQHMAIDMNNYVVNYPWYVPPSARKEGSYHVSSINCGNFTLFFEDEINGTGIGYDPNSAQGAQMQSVACAVFTYISQVFTINGNPEVIFSQSFSNSSVGYLAAASPFFDNVNASGFAPTYIQTYAQTGIDPDPNSPDAHIITNLAYNYNLNYTSATTGNQYDLYSILLHEAMHTMGFASLINSTGQSKINGPYSTYDKFLINGSGVTLITSNGASYNPSASLSDIVTNNVFFKDATMTDTHPSYSPILYSLGSSLSHFDILRPVRCDNYNYVMHPNIGVAMDRRKITLSEFETMCKLGYSSAMSITPCSQNYPRPNSYTASPTLNQIFSIPIINTATDPNGDPFTVDVNYPITTSSGSAVLNGSNIDFTPQNNFIGQVNIIYSATDNNYNSNLLDTYNPICITLTYTSTFCPDDPCNLVCNGTFENRLDPCVYNYNFSSFATNMSSWIPFRGSPDILMRSSCAGPPTQSLDFRIPVNLFTAPASVDTYSPTSYDGNPNNTYIQMIDLIDIGNASTTCYLQPLSEGVSAPLPMPLVLGRNYLLTMKVFVQNNNASNTSQNFGGLNLGFDINPPSSSVSPCAPNETFDLDLNAINPSSQVIPCGSWQTVSLPFTATTSNLGYLVIENRLPLISQTGYSHYVYLDDVVLKEDLPQITISKTTSTLVAVPGQNITYTITVCNTGNNPANAISFTDYFPQGLNYVSGLGPGNSITIPTLAGGGCLTYTVVAQVDPNISLGSGQVTLDNCVYLTSASSSCGSVSSSNCVTVYIPTSDVIVSKSADRTSVHTGDIVNYTITVATAGPYVTGHVTLNEVLPPGLTLQSYSISGVGTWNGSVLDISPGIPANQPTILSIQAMVTTPNTTAICHLITNCVSVATLTVPDPNTSNNSACVNISQEGGTANIVSNSSTLCNSTVKLYTLTNPGIDPGINYFWTLSSGNILSGQGTTVVMVDWLNSCGDKTLTLTITNPAGGCTSTFTYIEPGCCPCFPVAPPDIIVDGNTIHDVPTLFAAFPTAFSSGAPNYVYNNPGGNLYINGTFNIPASSTLTSMTFAVGSNILMATNAKITISNSPTCTLNIYGTHISSGCGGMWDGIYFGGPSKTVNVSSESLIEDAKNALVSISGGKFNLNHAIFNKNYIGVWVRPYTGNLQATVVSTVFTCRTLPTSPTLLSLRGISPGNQCQYLQLPVGNNPIATLLPPYAGKRSYNGIYVEKNGISVVNFQTGQILTATGVSIGNGGSFNQLNVFDNLDYGIFASSSNLFARNNHFQNLTGPTTFIKNGGVNYGVGIYGICDELHSTTKIIVGGTNSNSFYDCNRGVDLNGFYDITVTHNCFQSNQVYAPLQTGQSPIGNYAIFVKSGRYIESDVADNEIINWNFGIAFFSEFLLQNNGHYFRMQGRSRIRDNRISTAGLYTNGTTQFVSTGITAQSTGVSCTGCATNIINGRMLIDNNTIYDAFNGIYLQGWNSLSSVVNTPRASANQIYLRYQPSNFFTIRQAGVRVVDNSRVVIYDNHVFGITASGNTTGKTALRGFYCTQNTKPIIRCNSAIDVGQCYAFEGDNLGASFWDNQMYNCTDGLVFINNGKIGQQGAPISGLNPNGIASDNYWIGPFAHSQTLTDNTSFASNSILYCRVGAITTPTLNLGPNAYVFLFSYFNVTGGPARNCNLPPPLAPNQGGNATKQFLARVVLDSIPQAGFVNEARWLSKQQAYNMLREDTTLMIGMPVLQQFYASRPTEDMGKVSSVDEQIAQTQVMPAFAINQTMAPQLLLEQNHKVVNSLYLKVLDGVALDTNQYQLLESIALQCPEQGGIAVYRARTLIELIDDNIRNWNDTCTFNSSARISSPESEANAQDLNTIRLYPNPNDGQMVLEYVLPENTQGSFVVFDMMGNKVANVVLLSGTQHQIIGLNNLASGLYFYQVLFNDVALIMDKIVIVR